MLAIILGITAAIIITIFAQKDAKAHNTAFDNNDKWCIACCTVLIACLVEVCAFAGYAKCNVEITKTPEIVASVDLVALQDNTPVTGSFFLGSGSLNNKTHYAFYYETEHGYKYETLDAESTRYPVYVRYISSEETPHIDRYSVVERQTMKTDGSTSWLVSIIAWLQFRQYDAGDLISAETTGPALYGDTYNNWRYEIYIPKGSIKTDYTIDLQ